MATLAENVAAVKAAQVAIDAAIVAKGGTTEGGLNHAAAAIQAIPTCGDLPKYIPPADWPDIREIIATDVPPPGVTSSDNIITLFYGTDTPTFRNNHHVVKWDDGTVTENIASRQLSGRGFHWAISYGVTDSDGNVTFGFGGGNNFVVWIYGVGNSSVTSFSTPPLSRCPILRFIDVPRLDTIHNSLFAYNYALEYVGKLTGTDGQFSDHFNLDYNLKTIEFASNALISGTYLNQASPLTRIVAKNGIKTVRNQVRFGYAAALAEIPEIDYSPATSVALLFYNCTSLREIGDTIDLSGVTESNSNGTGRGLYQSFRYMYGLLRVPTHMTCAFSFGFNESMAIERDSIATFDAQMRVYGGLAYHINEMKMAASVASVSDLPVIGDKFTIYDVSGVKYRWRYITQTYTKAFIGYEDTATVTFHGAIKNKFTSDEQLAVEAAFNSKGWTLAW